jgi:hypothetical protein
MGRRRGGRRAYSSLTVRRSANAVRPVSGSRDKSLVRRAGPGVQLTPPRCPLLGAWVCLPIAQGRPPQPLP